MLPDGLPTYDVFVDGDVLTHERLYELLREGTPEGEQVPLLPMQFGEARRMPADMASLLVMSLRDVGIEAEQREAVEDAG